MSNHVDRIEIDGPFSMSIVLKDGTVHMLLCSGGEWRLDGLWVAQGRKGRWRVLAQALDTLAPS